MKYKEIVKEFTNINDDEIEKKFNLMCEFLFNINNKINNIYFGKNKTLFYYSKENNVVEVNEVIGIGLTKKQYNINYKDKAIFKDKEKCNIYHISDLKHTMENLILSLTEFLNNTGGVR